MENFLTMEEIKRIISEKQNAGGDGFSVEFYEIFLDLLGGNLWDCYNEAFQNQLSISQRRGIIFLTLKSEGNVNEVTC